MINTQHNVTLPLQSAHYATIDSYAQTPGLLNSLALLVPLAHPLPYAAMGPPRRKIQETVDATLTPPDKLAEGQVIARVIKAEGNNLYTVEMASSKSILVELSARFRSTIWLKRGGYVLVDTTALADRDNKLDGEIVNVVRDEKRWRKETYWPKDFVKKLKASIDVEDESTVGKMPPSEDEAESDNDG